MFEVNLEDPLLEFYVGKLGEDLLDQEELLLDGEREYPNRVLDVEEAVEI